MRENVCRYNKYGYCMYGDKCHSRHVNVICVNSTCTVFDCENRHPVVCKFFRNFKRCKFSNCSYKHEIINEVKDIDVKFKTIETRLIELEEKS